MSTFTQQLQLRRTLLKRSLQWVADATGIASSNLSPLFNGKKDPQASTLEALADAMDARWILMPKHLLPEVDRLLAGKSIGPDDLPSSVDRLFAQSRNE